MSNIEVKKVKDLVAVLATCDPEGELTFSLSAALVDADNDPNSVGIAYGFPIQVSCALSTEANDNGGAPDRITFELGDALTDELLAARDRTAALGAIPTPAPAAADDIALNAPVAVAVPMTAATYANLATVVANCNHSHKASDGATSHGELTVASLLAMLAEDAAMTNSRPGSWEGANMQQVLDSHGYS